MRIKKLPASLVLFFLTTSLPAQEKFAEYHLSPQELVTRDAKLLMDDSGNLLADIGCFAGNTRVLLYENEAAKIIYQDSTVGNKRDDAVADALKNLQKIRSLQRLATVSGHGIYIDCYYSGKKEAVYFVEINAAKGTAVVTDTVALRAHEHIITVLEDSGAIYMLSYLDKSDIIYLNIKKPGNKLGNFEKIIPLNQSDRGTKKEDLFFSDFFKVKKSGSYFVYDSRHPDPSYLSAIREKVYHFPGKLVFSLDNNNFQTRLVTLNLEDFKHDYHLIQPPVSFMSGNESSIMWSTSSFLSNDILFKTGGYGKEFFISAVDIYTGAVYCNYVIQTDKFDSIAKNPFFSGARYNKTAAGKKKSLGKYLDMSTIGVAAAGNNLFDIEISSLYQGMDWGHVLLSIAASAAGTHFINSIPNTAGFSLFAFNQTKKLSISNTLDISTGKFVSDDTAGLSRESWNQKIAAVNKFIEQYDYQEDKAQAIITGNTVYVYLIDPAREKLLVYKF